MCMCTACVQHNSNFCMVEFVLSLETKPPSCAFACSYVKDPAKEEYII